MSLTSSTEILSLLKLLGHIQKGEKIDTRNRVLQTDGWITRLNRTLVYPDNRANTLDLLTSIINRSFDILSQNISSERKSDIIQCKLIIYDLVKSKEGILNLKFTYSSDVKFGCDLEVLLQIISARLAEMKNSHPNLFERLNEFDEVKENNDLP